MRRDYGDGCLTAHALDLVGDRWSLLIARELMFGPKRFNDIQSSLRDVSSSMLSRRLHDLEDTGIIRRCKLGPPASTWAYELTEWGSDLDDVLIALGRWGAGSPFHDPTVETSTDALMLALRTHLSLSAGAGQDREDLDAMCAIQIDDDRFIVHIIGNGIDISRGNPSSADLFVKTSARVLQALITGQRGVADAVAAGELSLDGETSIAEFLFRPGWSARQGH